MKMIDSNMDGNTFRDPQTLNMEGLIARHEREEKEAIASDYHRSTVLSRHRETNDELQRRSKSFLLQNLGVLSSLNPEYLSAIGPIIDYTGDPKGIGANSLLTCDGHAYITRKSAKDGVRVTWMPTAAKSLSEADVRCMQNKKFTLYHDGWEPSVESADYRLRPTLELLEHTVTFSMLIHELLVLAGIFRSDPAVVYLIVKANKKTNANEEEKEEDKKKKNKKKSFRSDPAVVYATVKANKKTKANEEEKEEDMNKKKLGTKITNMKVIPKKRRRDEED